MFLKVSVLYYKATSTQVHSCKMFNNAFFYRTAPMPVQRCFSDMFYAQPISDNRHLPQWQTNLKIHSLTKNLFQQNIFVTDLEPTPSVPEIWSKHWQLGCSFALLKNLHIQWNLVDYIFSLLLISLFLLTCSSLYQTTKVFLAFAERRIVYPFYHKCAIQY